ncbi:glycosyltransferase family 4 protein [Sphingomonas sp. SUN019]|uniref:glycosyltransferase family 4 protein n=1 Tax=Sphingomonas sp. SUN019 TaxID=2937788 RepID=UPI002164B66D|nr:glycosyltransferase family 4 protein [Sphingomonas sp. SUN019]UVO49270.1 glycosyltransferase family 4 protein [Sphingomonas sp. SUN019]
MPSGWGFASGSRVTRPAPHIAFVIAGLGAGGAERVISLLASHWLEKGYAVTIIAFDPPDAPIFHPIERAVRIIRLGIGAERWLAGVPAMARRLRVLRRTLDELSPDVTISFLTKINVLSLLACLGTNRRVVVSERNNPRLQQAHPLWTKALVRLHWRANAIVMQTSKSCECLDDKARARARVIPNPIEITPSIGAPRSTYRLAAAGRLTWQKGFDMLIDAFAQIADRHPGWSLAIWGDGEDRAALQRQIDRLGLSDRISLPGTSRSPGDWVGQSDAFVFSSRYEGFGNALGEAMAAGLPVVSFDCDYGPADMIDDERNGLLVPPNDVPALAVALERLLSDLPLRERLGAAARNVGILLRPSTVAASWDDILTELDIVAG